VGRDGADLRELEGGISEGAVVDRHLDALGGFGLFGEGSRTADPRHHLAQLLVKGQAGKVALDGSGVPGRHPRENLVQRLRTAHLLDLLEDHGRELSVALGEHRVRPLREREEEGRPAAAASLRVAHDKAVPLEVGQVLADGVWRHAEVR